MTDFEGNFLKWGFPIVLILASLLLRPLLATGLVRLGKALKWSSLEAIASGASWIIVPLCLDWAAKSAPIPMKWAMTLSAGAYIALIFIVMAALRMLILNSMDWAMRRVSGVTALSEGFIPLLRNLVTLFTITFGAILILKHFGYDVWSLITALGVGSLAVGLAAKDTLSHMISGFVLIIDRNLRPGDRISFSGATGTVEEIGLRSTRLVTAGGSAWIVPNSELVNTKILNFSHPQAATRITTTIKAPLQIPLEKIREVGRDALRSVPGVDGSREFEAHLVSLVEGHQTIELSFWTGTDSPEAQARALSTFLEEFSLQARGRQIPLIGTPPAPPA
jgi:small-conductance mechanosensitive channel